MSGERRSEPNALDRLHRSRVLIVSGTGAASRRYRCEHRVEQLGRLGVEASVQALPDCDLKRAVRDYDCFVLHRVKAGKRVERFLAAARGCRKPTVYDTDDLIFEPFAAELLTLPPLASSEEMRKTLERQRRTLALCNGVTVSTEPLAELARRRNRRVAILPNVVSRQMVDAAASARGSATRDRSSVTIGYFSGTPTHDRDFAEATEAVLEMLATRPATRLLAVGPVSLDARFGRFAARVERVGLRPWHELPSILASTDVNIAPLEAANRFTAGKSCVKFLEAGLVDVPTIASPVPDFARVIEHGRNGMLARTPADWSEALGRLADDAGLRARLGRAAGADVRRFETTEARAQELVESLAELFEQARPSVTRAALEKTREGLRIRTGAVRKRVRPG